MRRGAASLALPLILTAACGPDPQAAPADAARVDAARADAGSVDALAADAATMDRGAAADGALLPDRTAADRWAGDASPPPDATHPDAAGVDSGAGADAAMDAGGADAGFTPECGDDGDCGGDRRCLAGICRDPCLLGLFCYSAASGDVCHQGLCVECEGDAQCTGGQLRCDPSRFACEPRPIDRDRVVIGAMYHQWWTPERWQGDRGNYAYEPVLGHYDNADAAVIAQHYDWAAQAGINTWVYDTWITDRDWWWVEANTLPNMDAADSRGLSYFLLVDGWFEFTGPDDGFDAAAIAAKIVERFSTWLERPGYLKVDGKPVLFFWAAWGKPCSLFDTIRGHLEASLGPVYLTGNNGETSCWDRVMMYNSYHSQRTTHAEQLEHQADTWSGWEERGFPWAPTTIPGYDDTHVRDGNPPIPIDPDFFRSGLQTALAYNQHSDVPWLFVCSWSEWHEGSQIEPTSDLTEPTVFLRVMREELTAAGWLAP